jgi:hypothetical protein
VTIFSTRPPRGGNPIAIRVQTPSSVQLYDTENTVNQHTFSHLSLWFWLAYSAPIYLSLTLMNDLGHLGDTECAREILNETYTFPPNTDKWTIKILQEAHHTWMLLNNELISTTISVVDFQGFGKRRTRRFLHHTVPYMLVTTRLQVSPRTYPHCTSPNSRLA